MVELILNSITDEYQKEKLVNLVTLDNQTLLARAACHPSVTQQLIQRIFNVMNNIDDHEIVVVIDMIARYRKLSKKNDFDYLKPLKKRLKNYNTASKLDQLSNVICRHDNVQFLEWFCDNIDIELVII